MQQCIPPMDNRRRGVCSACGYVHYENPRVVAGCIPVWRRRVLLCQRAIEPRDGLWTLPAGFMELDETASQAAMRETLEEANARVALDSLFALFSLPHVNQVYLMYRARLLDGSFSPGPESRRVALFREDCVPWEELAFASIRYTLELFFRDRGRGAFAVHTGDVLRKGSGYCLVDGGEADI